MLYFIFLGSKINSDSNYSHRIKRCLIFERITMRNLDSVLKRRDITLLIKVCIGKAIVFPVVRYECESWTIKKAEPQRIDAFETVVLEKTLESPLDSKELKPVNLKGNQPKYSLEGLMLKVQSFGGRADSLEKTLMLVKV